mgnify:FL=1
MGDETLITETRGAVRWLTVNRPARRNAYTGALFDQMIEALAEADSDPSVLAVVLTGAGDKAFSTGADLKPDTEYSPLGLGEGELVHPAVRYFLAADAFSKPLIARVNGDAMAGGMGVLAMCDLAVAGDHARFALPEVRIGLFPVLIVAALRRIIPRRVMMEMAITGEFFDAVFARDISLVNYVIPLAELDAKVEWLTDRIVNKAPMAVRRGKHAMRHMWDMNLDDSLAYAQSELVQLFATRDHAEGLAAFNEKRAPDWPSLKD